MRSGSAGRAAWCLCVVVAACAQQPSGTGNGLQPTARSTEISPVEYRWDEGPWSSTPSLIWEPPGRGEARRLTVRFTLPSGDWVDPAVHLSAYVYLKRAEVDGRLLEPGPFLPVRPGELGRQLVLTFESTQTIREGRLMIGSQKELRAGVSEAETGVLWVSFAMVVMAAVLAVLAMRRGSEAVLLGLSSLIALSCGLLILQQTTLKADLVPLSPPVIRAIRDVAAFVFPASLCAFFALTVPQRSLPLRVVSVTTTAGLGVALLLQLGGLVSLRASAWFALGAIVISLVLVTVHLVLARRESLVARRLLLGMAIAGACAVPDLSWGLASVRLVQGSIAHWGLLPLMASLVLVVQDRFRADRGVLEQRVRDIERLNEELRFQVESRSRELRDALAARPVPARRAWAVGDLINDRYRLDSVLGRGGMAEVFAARRLSDGRQVAVKVLSGDVTRVDVTRFAREAEVAARLRHRNLVPVVDVGTGAEGSLYLVMELVGGPNLEQLRARFGEKVWARQVLRDVAAGLQAAHEAGVVHRDLKPSNVLLDGEVARLCDFGVATLEPMADLMATVSRRGLTRTGTLIGTPRYLAPEVVDGGSATRSSDAFAFGLLAFELFTGKFPFTEPPFVSKLTGHPLTRVVGDDALPPTVRPLTALLAVDPAGRPGLPEVIRALDEPLAGLT